MATVTKRKQKAHQAPSLTARQKKARKVHIRSASPSDFMVKKANPSSAIVVSARYSTGGSIVLGHEIGTRLSLGLPELKPILCPEEKR